MELIEIARLYKTIKRHYPAFDASTDAVRDAQRFLKDIPPEVATENVDKHILSERFPPTIADIRGNYKDHSSTIPNVEETRRQTVWLDHAKGEPMPEHTRARLREIARRAYSRV